MAKKQMPEHVARAVIDRADGRCEVMNPFTCTGFGEHLHHRKISGREHTVENVVSVCSADHRWIHANPAESYRLGWLVKMGYEPGQVPMKYRGRPVLLAADGGVEYQVLDA